MTMLATINTMQTIHAGISGVVAAPQVTATQKSINSADCPTVLTWPTGADWDRHTLDGVPETETQYTITVFIAPTSEGLYGEMFAEALTVADALRAYYQSDAGQDLNDTVEFTSAPQWLGLRTVKYADLDYYGFQITISVMDLED